MTILQTPRLLLRRFRADDLDDLSLLYADAEVRRWIPEGVLTREQTERELEVFVRGLPAHPQLGLWATIDRASGRLIGRCGLIPWTIDGHEEIEIAFMFERACWGRGLATEVAAGLAEYAFATLGLRRVICLVVPGNLASARVASKIGMGFEREYVDEIGPSWIYALQDVR